MGKDSLGSDRRGSSAHRPNTSPYGPPSRTVPGPLAQQTPKNRNPAAPRASPATPFPLPPSPFPRSPPHLRESPLRHAFRKPLAAMTAELLIRHNCAAPRPAPHHPPSPQMALDVPRWPQMAPGSPIAAGPFQRDRLGRGPHRRLATSSGSPLRQSLHRHPSSGVQPTPRRLGARPELPRSSPEPRATPSRRPSGPTPEPPTPKAGARVAGHANHPIRRAGYSSPSPSSAPTLAASTGTAPGTFRATRIWRRISSNRSGFSTRNRLEFSRPWPSFTSP